MSTAITTSDDELHIASDDDKRASVWTEMEMVDKHKTNRHGQQGQGRGHDKQQFLSAFPWLLLDCLSAIFPVTLVTTLGRG